MGTRSATTTVDLKIQSTIKNTLDAANGLATQGTVGKAYLSGVAISDGVSINQANRAWEDRGRIIANGNTEDLDLYDFSNIDIGAGTGLDALGQAIVHEEIVAIIIKQTSDDLVTGGRLEIMPSNPTGYVTWMPSMTVANGGAFRMNACLFLYNPGTDAFDITDGGAGSHVIRLKANGGEVTYEIMVLARHDDDESSSSSSSSNSSSSSSASTSSSSGSSSSSSSSSSVSSGSSPSSSASSVSSSSECSTS